VKVSAEAKEAKEDDTPSGDAAATPAAATTSTATDDAASAAKPKANGVDDEVSVVEHEHDEICFVSFSSSSSYVDETRALD
jgi:hypothetical protein